MCRGRGKRARDQRARDRLIIVRSILMPRDDLQHLLRENGNCARLQLRKHCEQRPHEGQCVFELRARGGEDDDCDAELRDVLLKAHVSVARDEDIELLFGEREQATVFDASPPHSLH